MMIVLLLRSATRWVRITYSNGILTTNGFRKTVPTSASDLSEIDVASLIHVLTKSKM